MGLNKKKDNKLIKSSRNMFRQRSKQIFAHRDQFLSFKIQKNKQPRNITDIS